VIGLRLEGNLVTDCFSVETITVRFARFTVFPYFSCSGKRARHGEKGPKRWKGPKSLGPHVL